MIFIHGNTETLRIEYSGPDYVLQYRHFELQIHNNWLESKKKK